MRRHKKFIQCFLLVGSLYAAVFLVLRTTASVGSGENSLQEEESAGLGWQQVGAGGPRSLMSGDYDTNSVDLGAGGGGPSQAPQLIGSTPGTPLISAKDLFISVKTTVHYHRPRLPIILKTWFQLAPQQIWFFTDSDDEEFQKKTNGHLINTNCSSSHNRKALCCKMSVEFDTFLESDKKWFCHFDDDNYVNVKRLVEVLSDYSPQEEWYLGKPSIRTPLEILNRESKQHKQNISFWFATGGAGFCLSRALALKMMPIASGGRFMGIGEKIRLPDDVTMGYIIEHLLKKPLTVIDQFHSHLEPMKFIRQDTFQDQISFSYSKYSEEEMNVVRIDGFDTRIDPTRFLSLHCFIFPHYKFCPR